MIVLRFELAEGRSQRPKICQVVEVISIDTSGETNPIMGPAASVDDLRTEVFGGMARIKETMPRRQFGTSGPTVNFFVVVVQTGGASKILRKLRSGASCLRVLGRPFWPPPVDFVTQQ